MKTDWTEVKPGTPIRIEYTTTPFDGYGLFVSYDSPRVTYAAFRKRSPAQPYADETYEENCHVIDPIEEAKQWEAEA